MSQARRHPRKPIKVELRWRDEAGCGELVFDSGDLSAGGAFLLSDVLLEQGETIDLEFAPPGQPVIRCRARVAWVRRFPGPGQRAGMGVEFLDLPEFDRRAIEALVER